MLMQGIKEGSSLTKENMNKVICDSLEPKHEREFNFWLSLYTRVMETMRCCSIYYLR